MTFGPSAVRLEYGSSSWLAGEGAEKLDPQDDRIQLAFRDLKKLKSEDLDKVLTALAAIRREEK